MSFPMVATLSERQYRLTNRKLHNLPIYQNSNKETSQIYTFTIGSNMKLLSSLIFLAISFTLSAEKTQNSKSRIFKATTQFLQMRPGFIFIIPLNRCFNSKADTANCCERWKFIQLDQPEMTCCLVGLEGSPCRSSTYCPFD